MRRVVPLVVACLLALIASTLAIGPAGAARISDVRNTKHNLSASGPGTVKATGESQICIFCHTPHAAETIPNAPLWNRKLSGQAYTPYASSSIEAIDLSSPDGSSKLCLSCHDGSMAIGSVNVLNGKANQTIAMTGTTSDGRMTTTAQLTGFTRNLGVNLTNDHPISFTYDAALAGRDGELRVPDGVVVGTRSGGTRPKLPLESGQVQCATCHDPHLREENANLGPQKFLRLNRFQEGTPAGGAFSEANDTICLACHDKAGQLWALSAHANPVVANELYTSSAAALREFPVGLPVWKAACLNCHDTHTVQGARRLLREGTDSTLVPKSGGNAASEETCYQCHTTAADSALQLSNNDHVPNIKTDFQLASRMPISQSGTAEVHDIGTGTGTQRGKDFVEAPSLLGKGNLANRHVECTDCHNPHRVIKNRKFNDNPASPNNVSHGGTHNHGAGHTNIASGVLKGTTGVEPTGWSGTAFLSPATGYELKRGDGGVNASEAVGSAWVTREYQVCLKCHSTYAYDTPPELSPVPRTGFDTYTDQAMEFQAPATHQGAASTTDSGAFSGSVRRDCTPGQACGNGNCRCSTRNFQTNNHRSWHPVMERTGRTKALRGIGATAASWRSPWNDNADVGSQTMYCSDCHGSNTAADTVAPTGSNSWGPHGSSNRFILKGEWSGTTGASGRTSQTPNGLCFKCHDPAIYANENGGASGTGFVDVGDGRGNLHAYHTKTLGRLRCSWCHIAVPHGWKNRSFLVNLNDVGPEGGQAAAGTEVSITSASSVYTNGPYYNNAKLKILSFPAPNNWTQANCGSATGQNGTGRDWMRAVCQTPP